MAARAAPKPKSAAGISKRRVCSRMTEDTFVLIESLLLGSVQLVKVLAGSLLLLTVPMKCGDSGMCSFVEMASDPWGHHGRGAAVEEEGSLAAAAVTSNFATIAAVALHYFVIFNRERLMIEMLDEVRGEALQWVV